MILKDGNDKNLGSEFKDKSAGEFVLNIITWYYILLIDISESMFATVL